ncbi:MAG TPA: MaoC family dehydratase [Pyrinomonadaceae bacterium]|jgi:3-hydroxybutyryl-CoA dehydratase|nr:MaoC family dehydratase [Pyrinomonadaceae bacterium]
MKYKVGDTATLSKTITDADIHTFADLIGDHNSVHLDDEFAARTRFGRRIAHGMLGASFISAALGEKLPGRGTVYLSQTFKFIAPVYPGDTITARVTVLKVREDKNILTIETVCEKQTGETVITGEAVVLVDEAQA